MNPLPHQLAVLESRIAPHRERLIQHSIYAKVNSPKRLHSFMESHVFAVWDFMSVLKALQRSLTCVHVPWLPVADTETCRLVNEIVVGEESDEDGRGGHASHFELYLDAMATCGANTLPALQFCNRLRSGDAIAVALKGSNVGRAAEDFVASTFDVVNRGRPSEIAAAFTFGREDVIPDMFRRFVESLCSESPDRFERFLFYLNRHIELDGDDHGPKALRMVASICREDSDEWAAAERAAITAIEARIKFWNELESQLNSIN
jgi:hypothetical protein